MLAATLLAIANAWYWHTPYPIRVLFLVFSAAWVALLAHELGHALMARILGVRLWSVALGRGPVLFDRTLWGTRIRLAPFPFHGEVRLLDRDAEAIGYRDAAIGGSHFEWREGRSWRAPLISIAGTLGNLLAAKAVLAFWAAGPRPNAPVLTWTLAVFLVNAFMLLNLMPLRGFDGGRIARHAAAWRRAPSPDGVPVQVVVPWPFASSLRVAALALLLALASFLFPGPVGIAIVMAATIAELVSAVAYAQARQQSTSSSRGVKAAILALGFVALLGTGASAQAIPDSSVRARAAVDSSAAGYGDTTQRTGVDTAHARPDSASVDSTAQADAPATRDSVLAGACAKSRVGGIAPGLMVVAFRGGVSEKEQVEILKEVGAKKAGLSPGGDQYIQITGVLSPTAAADSLALNPGVAAVSERSCPPSSVR